MLVKGREVGRKREEGVKEWREVFEKECTGDMFRNRSSCISCVVLGRGIASIGGNVYLRFAGYSVLLWKGGLGTVMSVLVGP